MGGQTTLETLLKDLTAAILVLEVLTALGKQVGARMWRLGLRVGIGVGIGVGLGVGLRVGIGVGLGAWIRVWLGFGLAAAE